MYRNDNRSTRRSGYGFMRSSLAITLGAVLISLIVLLLTSFSAFTLNAAQSKMKNSKDYQNYSQSYYAAESTASEIIADFSKSKKEGMSNLNGISTYESPQGSIEVTRIDSSIYLSVPINKKEHLKVEAKVTKKDIEIIKWFLTKK